MDKITGTFSANFPPAPESPPKSTGVPPCPLAWQKFNYFSPP